MSVPSGVASTPQRFPWTCLCQGGMALPSLRGSGLTPKRKEVPTQQGQLCHLRHPCAWFTCPACPGPTASIPVWGRHRAWCAPVSAGANWDGARPQGTVSSIPSPSTPELIPTRTQPPALARARTAAVGRRKGNGSYCPGHRGPGELRMGQSIAAPGDARP